MFSPRILRILLVLSVTLNLIVIGIIAGAALRDPPRPHPDRGPAFGMFDRALTEDDRKALREAFRRDAPDFGDEWQKMQADLGDLLTVLRTEPYDTARVEEIFARQLERGQQMAGLGQRLMVERLAGMTAAERGDFADRLARRIDRDRKGHGDGPPPRP